MKGDIAAQTFLTET